MGYREVSRSVKESKIIISSASLDQASLSSIRESCKGHGVPLLEVEMTSMGLAKLVGKPFRISVLSVKNAGDADIGMLLESAKSQDQESV